MACAQIQRNRGQFLGLIHPIAQQQYESHVGVSQWNISDDYSMSMYVRLQPSSLHCARKTCFVGRRVILKKQQQNNKNRNCMFDPCNIACAEILFHSQARNRSTVSLRKLAACESLAASWKQCLDYVTKHAQTQNFPSFCHYPRHQTCHQPCLKFFFSASITDTSAPSILC